MSLNAASTSSATSIRKEVLSLNGSVFRKPAKVVRKAVFPVAGLGTRFFAGYESGREGNAAYRGSTAPPVCGR